MSKKTVEEAATAYQDVVHYTQNSENDYDAFIAGVEWQKQRMFEFLEWLSEKQIDIPFNFYQGKDYTLEKLYELWKSKC